MRCEIAKTRAGAAGRAGHDRPEDRRLAAAHERRVALEGQVLHRQHGRARERERERVDEVRERRAEAAEEPRHAQGHPQLLHAGGQVHRLDPVGHEVGSPGDRGEAEPLAGGRQRAQELAHVRLVPGAVAPEHVGVDHDERIAHAGRPLGVRHQDMSRREAFLAHRDKKPCTTTLSTVHGSVTLS